MKWWKRGRPEPAEWQRALILTVGVVLALGLTGALVALAVKAMT